MSGPHATMWNTYAFRGFTVMVVQRWNDPFGVAMVRVADVDDEERAVGMPESMFMAQAVSVAPSAE